MDDAALLRRLAIEKLEAKAAEFAPAMGVDKAHSIPITALWRAARARSRLDSHPNSQPRSSASSSGLSGLEEVSEDD
jgi:hypothetical protein